MGANNSVGIRTIEGEVGLRPGDIARQEDKCLGKQPAGEGQKGRNCIWRLLHNYEHEKDKK